jgi:hypothetical protein
MRKVLDEKKQRLEAGDLRAGILEGYQDAIAEKTKEFSGDLKKDMARFKKLKKK